jgi:hypothetical protein
MNKMITLLLAIFFIVFVSFSANAYPIKFSVEGTFNQILDNETDFYNLVGETFTLEYVIDSDKAPVDDGLVATGHIYTVYSPDSITFAVNNHLNWQPDPTDLDASLRLEKFASGDVVQFDFHANNLGGSGDMDFYLFNLYNSGLLDIDHDTVISIPDDVPFGPPGKDQNLIFTPYNERDYSGYASVKSSPVPEPTTMLLFGAGLVGLAGFGRKKFKK